MNVHRHRVRHGRLAASAGLTLALLLGSHAPIRAQTLPDGTDATSASPPALRGTDDPYWKAGAQGDGGASAQQGSSAQQDPGLEDDPGAAAPAVAAGPLPSETPATLSPGAPDYGLADLTPNFGKPRKKRRPEGRAKPSAHPLPGLQPYATAVPLRGASPVQADDVDPPPTVAAIPTIPAHKRPKVDTDPFGPLGIDIGSLRLFPYVETSAGFDSNPAHASGGTGSPLQRIEAGATLQSLWSDSALAGHFEAGYQRYSRLPTMDAPDAKGDLLLHLNATRDTAVELGLTGVLSTQQPGTPGLPTSLANRPLTTTVSTSAGVIETLGATSLGLRGIIDRNDNQDGQLVGGGISRLSDENNTGYALQANVGYEIRPGIVPFVKVQVDTRRHDTPVDLYGYRRDSNGLQAEVGTSFELTRKLTGTIGAGYGQRHYADSRLPDMRGPILDASLVWSATPLIDVTLGASTTQAETTLAGASGTLAQKISLGLSYALLRNLTFNALTSLEKDTYPGTNLRQEISRDSLGLQYSLTRSIVVKGTFTHEHLRSNEPGSDYTSNVFLVGLRLQR